MSSFGASSLLHLHNNTQPLYSILTQSISIASEEVSIRFYGNKIPEADSDLGTLREFYNMHAISDKKDLYFPEKYPKALGQQPKGLWIVLEFWIDVAMVRVKILDLLFFCSFIYLCCLV